MIEQKLKGKRILFIALPGYSKGMKEKMEDMGAEVIHINDKPKDTFLGKALGRLALGFYENIINDYYAAELSKIREKNFDYILVIRGEYTPKDSLERMRSYFPTAKMVLYMWDSLVNNKFIRAKWEYYDKVYTFDRIDYLNHKESIDFLPLFYYEDYLPKNIGITGYKYDMSFIGTGHEDRVKIVKALTHQLENKQRNVFSYFFIPHKLVYYLNKIKNPHFKYVQMEDVEFKQLPFEKLYEIYSQSKCVVDIESSKQNGLTMRTIEMIGLEKKLITTNKDIVHYDFFNPANIMILDRNDPVIDLEFIDKPYIPLDEKIRTKYSLHDWILNVLEIT
ncbi:lipopolysaccharide biosynthesis protein [Streptococcus suis]|nr:lipopolysaccharide biosynthesis protein [Streptococcus suis]